MNRIARLCGFKDPNEKIARLAWVNLAVGPSIVFTLMMSSTYYIIFVADNLGGGYGQYMSGIALVGVLVVIRMVIQTLLDYPTGTIGDMLGQRYVIASAYLMYGVAFYLTSILIPTTPFAVYVLIYILWGFAYSQESGAWTSWFDSNYQVAMPDDVDRKQYGVFSGRMGTIAQLIVMSALVPGSILAIITSRMWVFQLSAILCIVTAFIVLRFVTDFPEVVEQRQERPSMGEYIALLKSGASFIVSDPFVKYLLIGGMILSSCMMVWGNLLIFPILYAYLITDVAVASYRTILRVPGLFTIERAGVWSQRFEPTKWIPRFRLLQSVGFVALFVFAGITLAFPYELVSANVVDIIVPFTNFVLMSVPPESLIPLTLMLVTIVIVGFFFYCAEILTMRIMIDVVPTRIRNSVYSLSPTIATIFAIPQIAFFGFVLQYIGFPITFALLGIVALFGVLLIRKGFTFPIPITEERKKMLDVQAAQEAESENQIEAEEF